MKRLSSALFALLAFAPFLPAAPLLEKDLLLRNRLGVARSNEVVIVSLKELGVAPDVAARVKEAEVLDGEGRPLPCQFDDFSRFPGFSAEVAFEWDFRPFESGRVTVRLLEAPVERKPACTVRLEGATAWVTTPGFTVLVRQAGREGLWIEQPKLTESAGKQASDDLDAVMGAESARGPVPKTEQSMRPPMTDRGLPFCVQGFPVFDGKAPMAAWGGPVRAVVGLPDRGVWLTGKSNTVCSSLQVAWFPRGGNRFFLDWRAGFETPVPQATLSFAGLRLNSADYAWDLVMGQDRKPPLVAPVIVPLAKTLKQPYLEPYQRASFNHGWAQAVSSQAWVAVVIDLVNSRFGMETNWGTGCRRMNANLAFTDMGPFENALQPSVRVPGLPPGDCRIRVMVPFGGPDDPLPKMRKAGRGFGYRWRTEPAVAEGLNAMRGVYGAFQSPLAVLPRPATPYPEPDWNRVRALAADKSVVLVVPDGGGTERTALWSALAGRLGAAWRTSSGFLQYFNVTCRGNRDKGLLTVVVGEPGSGELQDQLNDSLAAISPYPAAGDRGVVAFVDESGEEGALLLIGGATPESTAKAVEAVMGNLGDRKKPGALTAAAADWADRMPYPWSGLKPQAGAFRTVAYRNGRAEFLVLLRAWQEVKGLSLEGPAGAECRFTPWRFESAAEGGARVVPLHDAAFAACPGSMKAGDLLTAWISLPVPLDAAVGVKKDRARVVFEGGECPLDLETEVLPVVLPDRPAIGFYPLGFDGESIRMYYGWDEETYLKRLPDLLRQLKPFGVNTYTLDVKGLAPGTDASGRPSVETAGFKRELDAVRSAGTADLLFVDSLNYLWNKSVLASVMRARKLADDFEAFELFVPEIRKALAEMGLEDKLVCRHGDEISDYENWLGKAEIYKRCGVKMTVAINGYGVVNRKQGVGTMGLWIPLYNFYLNRWGKPIADDDEENFSKAFRDTRHAAGEPIWPYVCGPGPYAWSPRPRSQARFLMLDTYMKGADGLTYYGGMVWSHALDPAFRKTEKADLLDTDATFTTLFYPDPERGAILPSIRAGAFRLGLEDASAVRALRERAGAKGRAEAVEAELSKAYQVLEMDSPQAGFDAFRRTLARLWDQAQ